MSKTPKKYFFDEHFVYLSGKKYTLEELQVKADKSKKNSLLFLVYSFVCAPLIGILINYILSALYSIPSYFFPLLTSAIFLGISLIFLIDTIDHNHTIKLYKIYLDKHKSTTTPTNNPASGHERINDGVNFQGKLPNNLINKETAATTMRGNANAYEASLITNELLTGITRKFIAIDVETTGLDEYDDRIVEISAVLFENFEVAKTFTSLIHSDVPISTAASKINHITNKMLENQPEEKEVIHHFTDFIGDAIEEKTILVAHNSKFDFKFIVPALIRNGINAELCTLDTLSLARIYMPELGSYKLEDLIQIINPESVISHRAEQDAVNCGLLFAHIIKNMMSNRQTAVNSLTEEELQYAQHIKEILINAQFDIELLRFSNTDYFTANILSSFVKIKFHGKKRYAVIDRSCALPNNCETTDCSKAEGEKNQRLIFNEVSELYVLDEYFIECAKSALSSALFYINKSEHCYNNAMRIVNDMIEI